MGIHYGNVGGVKTYFIHNPELFPAAFEGKDPYYVMKQLVFYARGTLELLC